MFTGRTDAEAPILWTPDGKNWLIGNDPDAGKDWRQEKGTTEDEMVGWHHRLDGHEFEQALEVGDEQGSLACCSQWGRKELDTTEWLNNFKTFGGPTYWSAYARCGAETIFFFFLPWGMQDLGSQTRDGTCIPYTGSSESCPLDHQGSPVTTSNLKLQRVESRRSGLKHQWSDVFYKNGRGT